MNHIATSIRKAMALVVVGIAILGWPAAASAAYKLWQNTTVGRVSAGARVDCNAPGGFVHWNVRDISWKHNTANQGAGKQTALQTAMLSWTNVPNATHQLNYDGTTSAGFATDGVNSLFWDYTLGLQNCNGCIALTAVVLQSGQGIIESDIIFNRAGTWTTNGGIYDTESVAAHELGHSLGIHHSTWTDGPDTMSPNYFGTAMRSLANDDMAALQCSESRYPAVCGGSPPPRPEVLTVTNAYCLGHNGIVWSASTCPVTRYEVWGSLSSSFTNPFLIYSGTATSTGYQVSQSQLQVFVWVKACNNALCSAFRGPKAAQYYAGCCLTPPC